MEKVFELVYADEEKVIVKVNAKDTLTVAMHPYISSKMDYITVTRGKQHTLTVVEKKWRNFQLRLGRIWGYYD